MTALVGGLLLAHHRERRAWVWALKPAAAATFLGAAIAWGALEDDYGRVIFAGLVLAALGDVLLIPRERKAIFLGGIFAFLLGHVGYAVAFGVRGVDPTWAGVSLAALTLPAAIALRWLWPHLPSKMRGPVTLYVLVITAMVALAVATLPVASDPRILLGAVGFYLSDLAVARDRFVKRSLANRLWGTPLYFFSQLCLAWTCA